jgi:hypothetical protein
MGVMGWYSRADAGNSNKASPLRAGGSLGAFDLAWWAGGSEAFSLTHTIRIGGLPLSEHLLIDYLRRAW